MSQLRQVRPLLSWATVTLDDVYSWGNVDTTADGCWIWRGWKGNRGYAYTMVDGYGQRVARLVRKLVDGDIPDGLIVRHTCDNHICVRESHLILGTSADNAQDAKDRRRYQYGDDHYMRRRLQA